MKVLFRSVVHRLNSTQFWGHFMLLYALKACYVSLSAPYFLSFRHTGKDKVRQSWLSGCFSRDLKTTHLGLDGKLSATHGKQTQDFRSGVRHLCPVNDPLITYKDGWQQSEAKISWMSPGGWLQYEHNQSNFLSCCMSLYVLVLFFSGKFVFNSLFDTQKQAELSFDCTSGPNQSCADSKWQQ